MTTQEKIDLCYRLQEKYPTIHVGGSLSLYLRGLDIMTDKSDLDLCSTDEIPLPKTNVCKTGDTSFPHDFDYIIYYKGMHIEIKIDKDQEWDGVTFDNKYFRVSKVATIVKYKKIYLEKGYEKHRADLEKIKKFFKLRFKI